MARDLTLLDGTMTMAKHTACHPLKAAQSVGHARALRPLLLGLAWCGCCAGSALLWHAAGPPLLLNLTASVPPGIYRLTPLTTLTRGMLVVFPPPPSVAALLVTRGYLAPQTPLLKPVAALPSETVCVHDDGVVIQGCWVAPVALVDSLGRPLPRWRGCLTLGADEVFPLSPWTPRSFDGRYVGPVRVGRLLGRAVPVWTWGAGEVRREEGERGQDKGTPVDATLPLENQRLGTRHSLFLPAARRQVLGRQSLGTRHDVVAMREACHVE